MCNTQMTETEIKRMSMEGHINAKQKMVKIMIIIFNLLISILAKKQ